MSRGQTIALPLCGGEGGCSLLQRWSFITALLRVPSASRWAIQPTVSVVSRRNRDAMANLSGSLLPFQHFLSKPLPTQAPTPPQRFELAVVGFSAPPRLHPHLELPSPRRRIRRNSVLAQ